MWHLNQQPYFSRTSVASSNESVEDASEPAFNSFESLRIDLDVTFHMHWIELFDSAHVKFGVKARP